MRGHFVSRTWPYDPTIYAPPRYQKAARFEAFVPAPIGDFAEAISTDLVSSVSAAESALSRLNTSANAALVPLSKLLMRSESIASSKIEGLQILPQDLIRAGIRNEIGSAGGNVAREVLANIEAMRIAIEKATSGYEFTPKDLIDIHQSLMSAAHNRHVAGVIREEQNWIGGNDFNPVGADFVPPPPEEIDALLADLCSAINRTDISPMLQAALVHAQFETIHPFHDGNGRTGRALIHVVLKRRNPKYEFVPPISIIFSEDKKSYINGLTKFREGNMEGWLETFLAAAINSVNLAERYLMEISELQDLWRTTVKSKLNLRADSTVWKILDIIPEHPAFTIADLVKQLGRSKPQVAKAIQELVDLEIITLASGSNRNRIWEATRLMQLLDEFGSAV